jgi:hypothetical protein
LSSAKTLAIGISNKLENAMLRRAVLRTIILNMTKVSLLYYLKLGG